ncbi:MAG: hypothetical protein MR528_07550 [Lachnospiraceae bacterium]|nr:hypothetical protein [Lachnospiraceae bacterium]
MQHKKLLIFTTAAVILSGCSGQSATAAFAPAETSLYITGEGTVTSATVETYENDYYSADELKAYAEEVLASFNIPDGSAAEPAATLRECTMENGTAKLLIDFKDAGSYLEFSEQYPDEESPVRIKKLDITTVSDGVTKGYIAGASFTKVSGKEKQTASDEVMKQSKLNVAAVEGPALIQTDGKIQYISAGVTVEGDNLVRTPDEGLSYIVFK